MKADKIINKLDMDFIRWGMSDEWDLSEINDYVTDNFKRLSMGLVLNNTQEINKVYTSTFPDEKVLDYILDSGDTNVLLFSHHAQIWDPTLSGFPFRNIDRKYLEEMKNRAVSFYVLHLPLDCNGEYSTTYNLSKALDIQYKDEFAEYFGVKVGVIGITEYDKLDELGKKCEKAVGHRIKLWNYGSNDIKNNFVSLVAGGGNISEEIKYVADKGINVYITGVTMSVKNYEPSIHFHKIAEELNVNVLGLTHYSSEKFAPMKMVDYFKDMGLDSEFIEGINNLNDLE
jgi:putative NIF3 family GTP cyclohydrolase 1 type 2